MNAQRVRFSVVGSLLALIAANGRAIGQDRLPSDVTAVMFENAAALSGITIEWKYRVQDLGLRSALGAALSARIDPAKMSDQTVRFSFDAGRFYYWREFSTRLMDAKGRYSPTSVRMWEEKSFDGTRAYFLNDTQKGKQPWRIVIKPSVRVGQKGQRMLAAHFLQRAGYAFPNAGDDYELKALVPLPFRLIDKGGELVAVSKRTTAGVNSYDVTIRTSEQVHLFVLDERYRYSVVRHELRSSDRKLVQVDELSDFRPVGPDDSAVLPFRCESAFHQWQGRPRTPTARPFLKEIYDVLSVQLGDVDDKQFALNYVRPGMEVADGTLPGAKEAGGYIEYVVPADVKDLDLAIARAQAAYVPQRTRWTVLRTFILCVNLLLIAIVAIVILRWWKNRGATS
jgi:hypothetical protein